jgi:ubiquinone/menaquinone biosynthesis C-methylase UbiE
MKTVLNVGCGGVEIHHSFKGWAETRLDIDPKVKPDIVADLLHMPIRFEVNFDAVYCQHCLEHLYYHEVPVALSEFYRVLRPGGIVFIGVPDLRQVAWKVACGNLEGVLYESPAGPVSAIDCIYGHRKFLESGNIHQLHKTGFTPGTLKKKMKAAGFGNLKVEDDGINIWASGVKDGKTSDNPTD